MWLIGWGKNLYLLTSIPMGLSTGARSTTEMLIHDIEDTKGFIESKILFVYQDDAIWF